MDKVAIQCKTKEEFKFLMELYEKREWKWYDGDKPTENIDDWDHNREKTCVNLSDKFTYSSKEYFKKQGYKIFELNEILKRIL